MALGALDAREASDFCWWDRTPHVNGSCSKGNLVFASFSAVFVRRRGAAARLGAATLMSGLVAAGVLAGRRPGGRRRDDSG